jgi:hypothetical protein
MSDIESTVLDLKMNCNSKINGEEVRDIIDKKLLLLNEYRKDADNINKKCAEMTTQFRNNVIL